MNVVAPDNFAILFGSNYGGFVAHCRRDRAPVWVDRVYNLVLNGYYNDNYFFRVTDKYIQFGTNGNPVVSNVYNWNSTASLGNCAILHPQPNNMPINVNGIHGLSNNFGTLSMSTSYNETTETTWNVTAELFINTGNNSNLDTMLFVPICTINQDDMERVVLAFPSFGEVEELGGSGPSLDKLYAQGNAYIESNQEWATMAETSVVRVACASEGERGQDAKWFYQTCGPCRSNLSTSEGYAYEAFAGDREWVCPCTACLDTCTLMS
jgi:cyclophilin family peptidyl-prolyl cis-trans isomerase